MAPQRPTRKIFFKKKQGRADGRDSEFAVCVCVCVSESKWMTLTATFLAPSISRAAATDALSRRWTQGRHPKPTAIITRHTEVAGRRNSPTTANSVRWTDVPPVRALRAVQVNCPLSLVVKVCRARTPLSGGLASTACPSRCQEKSAGGSESDRQVRRMVWPAARSPLPTQSFGVSLVSTGVSGPSGERNRGEKISCLTQSCTGKLEFSKGSS